jgi:hypothetical protein
MSVRSRDDPGDPISIDEQTVGPAADQGEASPRSGFEQGMVEQPAVDARGGAIAEHPEWAGQRWKQLARGVRGDLRDLVGRRPAVAPAALVEQRE